MFSILRSKCTVGICVVIGANEPGRESCRTCVLLLLKSMLCAGNRIIRLIQAPALSRLTHFIPGLESAFLLLLLRKHE